MKWFVALLTGSFLCSLVVYFACTEDTVFNPTDIPGITIAAYACDTTGLDTTMTQFDSTLSIDSALAGQTITFLGFIKGDSASVKDITWSWDFGDGEGSKTRIVEHRYIATGIKKAIFTITNSVGVSLSDTVSILAKAVTGAAVKGYTYYQGKIEHDGITIVFAPSIGADTVTLNTAKNGLYTLSSYFPKGNYNVSFYSKENYWYTKVFLFNVTVEEEIMNEITPVILRDTFLPEISNHAPTDTVKDTRTPTIKAAFTDKASGIAPQTFLLVFSGDTITHTSLASITDSGFNWLPKYPLPNGNYSVYTSIKDCAGNHADTTWFFTIDAMTVSIISDTVVDYGGSIRCSVNVAGNFGILKYEIDTANSGFYKTIPGNGTHAKYVFNTGNICLWDSVKVRVTDEEGNVMIRGFKVDIKPRPLTITSIDSTVNTLTLHYSPTLESDFAEYRIYRHTTNEVDMLKELWATITNGATTNHSITPSYDWLPRYYRIYQKDSEGLWSAGSNVVYGNIANSLPSTPVITDPANDGDSIWSDDAVLRWSKCSDANNHVVKYRALINHNNTGYVQLATELTDTSKQLQGYDSLEIKFKVIAYDSEGDSSDWSAERQTHIKWWGKITDIDGNIYPVVKIGNRYWMAENLKTTRNNDGTAIPLVTDSTAWNDLTTPGYCWHDLATFPSGALYNWYAVNTGNLAPAGWHVPTDTEWSTLTTYLGGESVAGGKLKEAGFAHWLSPNTSATNETGFSALPGGYRSNSGMFLDKGRSGYWWSATESDSNHSWNRIMFYDGANVYRDYSYKYCGFSVRCVRD